MRSIKRSVVLPAVSQNSVKNALRGVACSALLFGGTAAQAQLTLDDFFGDQFILTLPQLTPAVSTVDSIVLPGDLNGGAPDVFGISRIVTVDTTLSGGTATAAILPPGGVLSFDTGATANPGAELTLLYDAFTSGSSVDVTDGGTNGAVSVEFLLVDGSADVSFTFTDGSSNSGTITESATASGSLLLSLGAASLSGVDLTDVESIEVEFASTSTASDFAIDAIQFVVPEPGTVALLASGATCIMLRRRRTV